MENPLNNAFNYEEFTTRNLGFVNEAEQAAIRRAAVFVCGVGGMGGACVQSLVRAGIGRLGIADFDAFEVSNFNRQVFANLDTAGKPKVDATAAAVKKVNPQIELEQYGRDWPDRLDDILGRYKIVINGMDDVRAGIQLYRKAREHNATVIDAYTSPLPSVTCVRPADPRPEERLGFPSPGRPWRELTDGAVAECVLKELEYTLIHSSSAEHIHMDYALDMIAGRRSRMSFAPMVITAGNLMCYEALKLILNRPSTAGCRGWFFNPFSMKVEKPRPPVVRHIVGFLVRRHLKRLLDAT